ncbi:MAG TPA: dipeptide epimerase [Chloroflexota bacterium]|jgi:L-alanine-DL-glutamate epimerase-like enolase superfamily enzyme|nr:dipeptide epimerase [Chloroflexota bacterium]
MPALKLTVETLELHLSEPFRISRGVQTVARPVLAHVGADDVEGVGEAAPSSFYGETGDTVRACLNLFGDLLGDDPLALQSIVEAMDQRIRLNPAAKAAVECALHDLIGKRLGIPLYKLFGLDPARTPQTSFTIGIADPEEMARKAALAAEYPILKVKVGTGDDAARLRAIRAVRSDARIRVDANAGWSTPREAAIAIERLAPFGLEFVEQPIASGDPEDWRWLRQHSPLPIFADESCVTAADVHRLAGAVDGVVVKLAKCGGLRAALLQIQAAHLHSLAVMIGCMIESSVGITAAAHLTPLVEYADLDGNLLVSDDPFRGVTVEKGKLLLPAASGLGVRRMRPPTQPGAGDTERGETP